MCVRLCDWYCCLYEESTLWSACLGGSKSLLEYIEVRSRRVQIVTLGPVLPPNFVPLWPVRAFLASTTRRILSFALPPLPDTYHRNHRFDPSFTNNTPSKLQCESSSVCRLLTMVATDRSTKGRFYLESRAETTPCSPPRRPRCMVRQSSRPPMTRQDN